MYGAELSWRAGRALVVLRVVWDNRPARLPPPEGHEAAGSHSFVEGRDKGRGAVAPGI